MISCFHLPLRCIRPRFSVYSHEAFPAPERCTTHRDIHLVPKMFSSSFGGRFVSGFDGKVQLSSDMS